MDLKMPVMSGLEAIGEIMASTPVPILVVSSVTDAGEAYEAIENGALDTVCKDGIAESEAAALVAKVKTLASIKVITHLRPGSMRERFAAGIEAGGALAKPAPSKSAASECARIFAIASSTGGPQALALILGTLPHDFTSPILVSQHIADGFAPGLAKWLSALCKLPVRIAVDGEPILGGTVYLSPSELNLAVASRSRLALVERNEREIFHPTCDVLLSSVAEWYGSRAVGVILTGMGVDGAAGMRRIREAGGHTIAQNESSSVVFGMNKVAIDMGVVRQVLPLRDITAAMRSLSPVPAAGSAGSGSP